MNVGEYRGTHTFRGLVKIRQSIFILLLGTMAFLVFASIVLILQISGVSTIGGLDTFWIMIIGFGVIVLCYIFGLTVFYQGYQNMVKGESDFGPEHAWNVGRAKKQLTLTAAVALVGWVLIPYLVSALNFMHPSDDLYRAMTVSGWLVSMFFSVAFVLICGLAAEGLVKYFTSNERYHQ
jgi:hypothetical protein